jgi:hypothetical protein
MNWTALDYMLKYPRAKVLPSRPPNFDETKEVARKLSQGFDGLIRVDLYSNGKATYVGELTNTSTNAKARFIPAAAEADASELLFGEQT